MSRLHSATPLLEGGLAGMRGKLCLLVISTCIATLVCEALARLLLPVRKVGLGFTQYDPVLGTVHKKRFSATQWSPEFSMTFSTNSLGFRGPEMMTPLPRHVPVLLFMGDSFTMGDGVNDGEEFPQLIASRLEDKEGGHAVQVINAGIADTGTAWALKFLSTYTNGWKNPTLLIYQFSPNDFNDNIREGLYALDDAGRLVERNGPVSKSLMRRLQSVTNAIPGLSRSYLVAGIRDVLVARDRRRGSEHADPRQEALTFRLVEELVRLATLRGWPVIGLLFELPIHQEKVIRTIYDRFGVTTVPVPSKAVRPDLYYRVDIHWDKEGHAYVAELLLRVIRAKIAEFHKGGSTKPNVRGDRGDGQGVTESRPA